MAQDNYLREWRESRDLSQDALAAKMTEVAADWEPRDEQKKPRRWGRTDILKVEKGRRPADLDFLRAAAAILRCSVNDIISRTPDQPPPLPEEIRQVAAVWDRVPEGEQERALNVLRQFSK